MSMQDCTVTLDSNVVQNNTASISKMGVGGGIRIDYSTATLSGNLIQGNVASETGWGVGGGMFLGSYYLATLDGNTFISNSATLSPTALGEGGGLAVHDHPAFVLSNNLFVDNYAGTVGSGIWCSGWSASWPTAGKLIHTTIADNRGPGGSIYVGEYSTLALTNTIFAGNDSVGITVTMSGTATLEATLWGTGDWSNGSDWGGAGTILTGTVNLWGDPAFVDPLHSDYHIAANSRALDTGINTTVTTDIDGDPRPQDGNSDGTAVADIGADERPPYCLLYLPLVQK